MYFTNGQIARKLKEVAAAYAIKKGNPFQIRAYGNVASSVEHATSELHDLWEDGNLDQVPGIGESLQFYLDELFKTEKVKHWEEIKSGISTNFFELLGLPGVGPKTAMELSKLGVEDRDDLIEKLESGMLLKKGFSQKIGEKILHSLKTSSKAKSGRILLPNAFSQAQKVLSYLKSSSYVKQAEVLGSLRRMVATVGDLDFAVSSDEPQKVSDFVTKMPGIAQVLDKGEKKVSILTNSGLRLDFLITEPESFGALLQHFTGSKAHNIHLRTLAEDKGLSLSEYGVKYVKSGQVIPCRTEKKFYSLLGMQVPPPEIREDTGEIQAASEHKLPELLGIKDIKGDLHIHDSFDIESSYDLGVNSLKEILQRARSLSYEYIGISNHNPSQKNHTPKQMVDLIKKHNKYIEQEISSNNNIRVLNLLEVNILPGGSLAVPDEGLAELDFAIASIHSSHNMPKDEMTNRIVKAISNPFVKVLGHPTNRLIERRAESDADWEVIFRLAALKGIAIEINASPDRLDLPDNLVRIAKGLEVKFVISTDSHGISGMDNMFFGASVARRGWLTKDDVVNCMDWTNVLKWFKIKKK